MAQILVIDDDVELGALLVELLEPEGFRVEVVHEPFGGLQRALANEHDLVVLDVMLPGMSGLELLRHLRVSCEVPVLMLTARGEDTDRILGLELGADDYLPKPFNPRELVARIHAIQRRSQRDAVSDSGSPARIDLGDIALDFNARTVTQNGQVVKMTVVEFSLLHQLLSHHGKVMTREELTLKVLSRELDTFDRSIDVHVSNVRRKLGNQINGHERIKTIRGVGYLYASVAGDS